MNSLTQVRAADVRKSFQARVLLVDDDKMLRDLFSSALCEAGYEVETADNGADALQRIEVEDFDLVITDWQMPILDGARLVLALRSAHLETPVIILSGALATNPLPDVILNKVFTALEKPVSISELRAAAAAALEPIRFRP
jgi:two-component system response regulator (stage 0 sporulation protein F)